MDHDAIIRISVDVREATFISFAENKLIIEDTADLTILEGIYEIAVTLLDNGGLAKEEIMTLNVLPAPEIEPPYLLPAPLTVSTFLVGEPVVI